MNYIFKPLSLVNIKEIESWRYKGYIKQVDMSFYHKNYDERKIIKGPLNCDGFAVFLEDKLIGLFEYYLEEDKIKLGLALHPSMVGKGFSTSFIHAGIQFAIDHYNYKQSSIYLTVDQQNIRAYKAYLKAGFIVDKIDEAQGFIMKKSI